MAHEVPLASPPNNWSPVLLLLVASGIWRRSFGGRKPAGPAVQPAATPGGLLHLASAIRQRPAPPPGETGRGQTLQSAAGSTAPADNSRRPPPVPPSTRRTRHRGSPEARRPSRGEVAQQALTPSGLVHASERGERASRLPARPAGIARLRNGTAGSSPVGARAWSDARSHANHFETPTRQLH